MSGQVTETVTETVTEGDGTAGPVAQAVAAVEVLDAAREQGRQEGMETGAMLAALAGLTARLDTMEARQGEMIATMASGAETIAALSQGMADLNARLEQEQAAHEELAEVIKETDDIAGDTIEEPQPATDTTETLPPRKRTYA